MTFHLLLFYHIILTQLNLIIFSVKIQCMQTRRPTMQTHNTFTSKRSIPFDELKNVVRHKNLYQPRNGIHHQVASSFVFYLFLCLSFYLFILSQLNILYKYPMRVMCKRSQLLAIRTYSFLLQYKS